MAQLRKPTDLPTTALLATHAHTERRCTVGACVLMEDGTIVSSDDPTPRPLMSEEERIRRLMLSDDPRIWHPL